MSASPTTFYVFHGTDKLSVEETLQDFKARLGPPDTVGLNTTMFDQRNLSLAELRHACDAIPFLADKRLVVVRNFLHRHTTRKDRDLSAILDYLPHLPPTTRLVFIEEKALSSNHPVLKLIQKNESGYAKRFDLPDSKALPRWIEQRVQKYEGQIEPQAAHKLAALIENDLPLLDQEIQKLALYTNGERAINVEDIDRLVPYAQTAIVFDMVDALGRREGQKATRTLHQLLDAGEHPLGLLAMIVRQFRLLILVKELKAERYSHRDIAERLGLHPYPARKLYNQATHFTAKQMEQVYRHLLDTDVAIKSGEIAPEIALDLLVAGLAATE